MLDKKIVQEWRNWQTRRLQVPVVVKIVWVQVPSPASFFICASNEPKYVLAQDLGGCRDNLRNSQSVFFIVSEKV